MLPRLSVLVCALVGLLLPSVGARASVKADIDLSSQRMVITIDGMYYATWPVSTARRGYVTPVGSFRPYLLRRMHYSSKYENAPMPHSVFFRGDYAIHGTDYVKSLGRPASHGCIRLRPENAAELYTLVLQHGFDHTSIRIRR